MEPHKTTYRQYGKITAENQTDCHEFPGVRRLGRLPHVSGKISRQHRHGQPDQMVLRHAGNRIHLHAHDNGHNRRPQGGGPEGAFLLPRHGRTVHDRGRTLLHERRRRGEVRAAVHGLQCERGLLHGHHSPGQLSGLQRLGQGRDGLREGVPPDQGLRNHRLHLQHAGHQLDQVRRSGHAGFLHPAHLLRRALADSLRLCPYDAALPGETRLRRQAVRLRGSRPEGVLAVQGLAVRPVLHLLDGSRGVAADNQRLCEHVPGLFRLQSGLCRQLRSEEFQRHPGPIAGLRDFLHPSDSLLHEEVRHQDGHADRHVRMGAALRLLRPGLARDAGSAALHPLVHCLWSGL